MLTRLTHAGFAFAAVVAAYQAYVLLVVPIVEPPNASAAPLQAFTAEDFARTPQSLQRYRSLLQAYFPADHWCFQAPPIILENDQTIVVCASNYERNDSGELRVPHCAVIYFPTVRNRAGAPPRDAIIMEPAGGATLQMDNQADGGFGALGRMQFGQLLGEVSVRSDMKEPGSADDLAIITRDLYMNEDLLRTPEAVQFQLGPNHGHGRGLEIRFVKTAAADGRNVPVGQLDALEITSEVAALVVPGRAMLLGDELPGDPAGSDAPAPPAEITCTGSFTVDFDAKVATFSEHVVVRQRHPDGKLDELRAPHELTIYFAESQQWGEDARETAGLAFGSERLEPATIEASGFPGEPVVLEAASQGASARGERLRIELLARKVSLNGDEEVSLTFRGAEVHAPMVHYELPPRDSPHRLGQLWAPGGTGWLKATPDPTRPGDVVEVRWTKAMSMVRRNGQPVLTLDGRPRVKMTGMGVLWADQLELHLREPASPATAAPANAAAGPLPSSIEVESIVATGNVGIESAELKCDVNRLELAVDDPAASAPEGPGTSSGAATAPSVGPAASQPTRPSTPSTRSPLLGLNRTGAPARRYAISGRVLNLRAVMREGAPQVTSIAVEGGVVFQESPLVATGEEPLRILAERLDVADADALDAKIKITGSPASGTLPGGLAEIVAQGARLRAPEIIVHRGTSQAWINSPGAVSLQMTRDPLGQPLAAPQDVLITWRESMTLKGDRITFLGDVQVKHTDGTLDTRQLVAVLTAPVQFDGAASSRPPELDEVQCWEGAVAEFVQRDELGNVTSQQKMTLQSLIVNQITGAIRGDGPGHIDSVHLAKGDGSWLVLPENVGPNLEHAAPVQQDASDKPPQLKHLSVDFVRGVDGNIHKPEVRVYGDVKTVYGPIDSWDQRLEMTPGGSPEPDVFWITCDSLKVSDSPLARLQAPTSDRRRRAFGQVELQAEVDVVIEGVHPEHGAFTLQGHRVSFDQAQAIFMAAGNDSELASITFQQYPGGPQLPQTAQKIMFFLNTKEMKFQGFQQIQWQQIFNK